jgi:hypothetical protein
MKTAERKGRKERREKEKEKKKKKEAGIRRLGDFGF